MISALGRKKFDSAFARPQPSLATRPALLLLGFPLVAQLLRDSLLEDLGDVVQLLLLARKLRLALLQGAARTSSTRNNKRPPRFSQQHRQGRASHGYLAAPLTAADAAARGCAAASAPRARGSPRPDRCVFSTADSTLSATSSPLERSVMAIRKPTHAADA